MGFFHTNRRSCLLAAHLVFLWTFNFAVAADTINSVGIVSSPIWYSKAPVYAGEAVRIYSGVFNNRAETIFVSVQFLDNGSPIGRDTALIPPKEIGQASLSWIPSKGSHQIQVRISEASVREPGKPQVSVPVEAETSPAESVSVSDNPETSPQTLTSIYEDKVQALDSNLAQEALSLASPVVQGVSQYIPEGVVEGVSTVLVSGNYLADEINSYTENKKEDIRKSILSSRVSPEGSSTEASNSGVSKIEGEQSLWQRAENLLLSFITGTSTLPTSNSLAGVAGAGFSLQTPFQYLSYFLLSAVQVIVAYHIIFWLVLVFGFYYLSKKIISLFSRNY